MDEIERLNQSFGIGVIELSSNPDKTRILFPAKHKKLDLKTIDKLSVINKDFEDFINLVEKTLTAEKKYVKAVEKELYTFSDKNLGKDILKYCKEKKIPFNE